MTLTTRVRKTIKVGVSCHKARGFQVKTHYVIQSYFKIQHSMPGDVSVERKSYNFNHLLCTVAIK